LRRSLQGEIVGEKVGESFNAYGIHLQYDYLAVIGVEIDQTLEISVSENDRQLIIFAMGNILREITKAPIEPVLINDQYYMLIGSCDSKNIFEVQLENTAKTIIEIIKKNLKVIVSVAISSIFSDAAQIGRAKFESQQALKYRIRQSEGAVIFADSYQNDLKQTDDKSGELKIDIEYMLKSFEYDKAYNLICEYIDNIQNDDYSTFQIKLTELFLKVYAIIEKICPASIKSDSHTSIIEDLLRIKSANNLKKWFYNKMIRPLSTYVTSGGNEVFKNRIAHNAVNYILKNLEIDISLESCAEYFNYSRSYLSKVFKSEIGMSFSEYLIKERINLAQKLLCETDLNINDIATKTRYNNAQNFIRIFKKIVGMTPGQYRRK
jgi:two-component system response regulator YesN